MSLGSLEKLPINYKLRQSLVILREKEVKEVYQRSLRSIEGVIME